MFDAPAPDDDRAPDDRGASPVVGRLIGFPARGVPTSPTPPRSAALFGLDGGDLGQPGEVPAALEGGRQKDVENDHRQFGGHETGPEGEDIGVVVVPGQPGRGLVVAQSGPGPVDLVGRDGLALTAAPEDDPDVGLPPDDSPGGGGTERGIVDRF